MKKFNLVLKRIMDIIASLLGGIILSPVFLVIAVLIKITSKGPAFFLQERLGYKGKVFKIIKFRTMIVNAEFIGEGLRVSSEQDPRITKVGKVLRATSLDELPQLINVFIGQMSLVGPRPPVTYFPYQGYTNYPDWAMKRFDMKPGITGLAQCTVRNSASWDERIKVDVQYINTFNILKDIIILFRTVIKVFEKENIYGNIPKNGQTFRKE